MKNHLSKFIAVILQLILLKSFSQDVDSSAVIRAMKDEPVKMEKLYKLAQKSIYHHPDESLDLTLEVYRLASRFNDNHYKTLALVTRGNAFNVMSRFDSARANFDRALKYCETTGNQKDLPASLIGLGAVERRQGRYKESAGFLVRAIKVSEETGNEFTRGNAMMTLANVYFQSNQSENSLKYFSEALEIFKKLNDETAQLQCLGNMGNVYYMKKDFTKATETFGLIAKQYEKKGNMEGLSNSLNNLGNVYAEQGKYARANEYYLEALHVFEKIGNQQGIILATNNIGGIYLETGKPADAVKYLLEGLEAAKKINSRSDIGISYEGLAACYSSLKDYKNAFEYQRLFTSMKDTLLNNENLKQINDMQARYESEKKDKELTKKDAEIFRQQSDAKQKSMQRNALIIGLALTLALMFMVLRGYAQKQKTNKLLESKNKTIEHQKALVEDKQKEILDSIHYARRIQMALIPGEKAFNKFLEFARQNN